MLEYTHDENISPERIIELRDAHQRAIERLETLLPIACERQGHQWSEPRKHNKRIGGKWVERDSDEPRGFCEPAGYWSEPPEYQLVFIRTCGVCGKVEEKKAIIIEQIKSPFE